MQSQQACNIWQQALSPLMQVMQQPSLVISHSQLHMTMLHWQTTMPFIMQQQLHMPSHIMRHMFCNMAQAIWSSHLQWILMPLGHFSIFIVQQGTMQAPMPVGTGMLEVDIGVPMLPIAPIIPRSIIIMLDIVSVLLVAAPAAILASSLTRRITAFHGRSYQKPHRKKVLRASGPSGGQRNPGKGLPWLGLAPSKHSQCSDSAKLLQSLFSARHCSARGKQSLAARCERCASTRQGTRRQAVVERSPVSP
jgi:hypothetical protein